MWAVRRRVRTHLEPLNANCGLLLAVSGGQDSMCLLDAVAHVWSTSAVAVCYVDHGLRRESQEERELVSAAAHSRNLQFYARHVDVRARMSRDGLSMEVAARQLRYDALRAAAREAGCPTIILGHTSTDQAETVLMHLFRGSGLRGLVGMRFGRDDLWRPLLDTSRQETATYCRVLGLDYSSDPTNQDVSILRNAVRHTLIPAVEALFPAAERAVLRLCQTVTDDDEYLGRLTESALLRVVVDGQIKTELWEALDPSLRKRVLLAHTSASPMRGGGLEAAMGQLRLSGSTPPAKSMSLLSASHSGEALLAIPGVTRGDGWRIDAAYFPSSRAGVFLPPSAAGQAFMDQRRLKGPLVVRTWRAGDRMEPLGSPGSRKLQDIFVDAKIPAAMRRRIPVVADSERVVWLPGIVLAGGVRVSSETEDILALRFDGV